MRLELRFFASVRETLGQGSETVEVPPEVRTLADLRSWLCRRGGVWEQALADGQPLRMACDQAMADGLFPLREGAEVAFFPPVTGG